MVFNSLVFACFFAVTFLIYWFVLNRNLKLQNAFILLASYFFYGWTDWRLLSYLIGVSALNFFLGIYIHKTTDTTRRKILLNIGLIQGIGGLAFFKYYNFFVSSVNESLLAINVHANLSTIQLIVPLGISFFTFRTMSYLLDVDKEKIQPTKDWIVFFNYVSFFPSLLSGPIDKAKMFIPQLEKKREFNHNQAVDGLRQILWGLFKKVVIADSCASVTTQIFDTYQTLPASTLLLGAFLYTIQIYTDFSGYSDMALGFARLIGFNITKNFDFPFFAQNISEFWRKWHISLTSWLTEYVFTPLSITFRDYDKLGLVAAIIINFTIIGIWHGPNWTYVLFGFLHGCYYIPLIIKGNFNKKQKIAKGKHLPTFKEFSNVAFTFLLVMLTFILFRSASIHQAFDYYTYLFSRSVFAIPYFPGIGLEIGLFVIIPLFMLIEWVGRENEYGIAQFGFKWPRALRWLFYLCLIITVICFSKEEQQFIYFQF